MSQQKVLTLSGQLGFKAFNMLNVRLISTTPVNNFIGKWREERGLPKNPNTHGPLTDLPDYSFLDGRPTPYGTRQRKRLIKQKEVAEQIIKLTSEIDFAVERHKQKQLEEEQQKKQILDNKLKPKGLLLLKKA